ncbi:MAG: hypothetical protein HRT38_12945 [Alteromonadaceae bacterium]|nr:hypothetical protein [Alteromonadaceae bacterium]
MRITNPLIYLQITLNLVPFETESIVSAVMTKYLAEKTIITVAHRLNTIVSADNIFVIHNGKVVESGHHELLLANQGVYYSLHQQCRI